MSERTRNACQVCELRMHTPSATNDSARDVRAADLQEALVKPVRGSNLASKTVRFHQTRRRRRRPTNIAASEASNPTEPVCERVHAATQSKWVKLRSSMSCPELRSHLRTEVRGVA